MKISKQWDMYRITVIVNKGWEFQEFEGCWKKHGARRMLSYYEQESNDYHARNNCTLQYDGTDFSLEQAFDHERTGI